MAEAPAVGTPRSTTSVKSNFSSVSHRYGGRHQPVYKYDSKAGREMPAWSTSMFALWDNTAMAACALTGVGVCVMHGQNQDAMNSNGCCFSCCVAVCIPGECGRQRRYLRKRLKMPGGEYICSGWVGDCFEAVFCLPLAVLQEAREIEIRSSRRWHWLRGFRGRGEALSTAFFGEETLERVLAPYEETARNVLQEGFFQETGDSEASSPRSDGSRLQVPRSVDSMAR